MYKIFTVQGCNRNTMNWQAPSATHENLPRRWGDDCFARLATFASDASKPHKLDKLPFSEGEKPRSLSYLNRRSSNVIPTASVQSFRHTQAARHPWVNSMKVMRVSNSSWSRISHIQHLENWSFHPRSHRWTPHYFPSNLFSWISCWLRTAKSWAHPNLDGS